MFGAIAGAVLLAESALAQPQPGRIVDTATNCATSNPFPTDGETISWNGVCKDGLLDGFGVLTWYRNGKVHERDEGTFRRGELHGEATITFADGSTIIGNYSNGKRNGEFIIIRSDQSYVQAFYNNDALVSERELNRRQARGMLQDKRNRGHRPQADRTEADPPPPAAAAATPVPIAGAQPQYYQPTPQPYYAAPPTPAAAGGYGVVYTIPYATVQTTSALPPWSPMANANALGLAAGPQYAAPAAPQVTYAAYPAPAPQTAYVAQPAYAALPPPSQPASSAGPGYVGFVPMTAPLATHGGYNNTTSYVQVANSADAAFVTAYAYERTGQYAYAYQTYRGIIEQHPSTPSAILANERLQLVAAQLPASATIPSAGSPSVAPAVTQQASLQPALPSEPSLPSVTERVTADYTTRRVCSARGLYANNGRWCGVVRQAQGEELLVEVSEVQTNSYFTFGFSAGECTGGQSLGWFSRGNKVWVPARCMR